MSGESLRTPRADAASESALAAAQQSLVADKTSSTNATARAGSAGANTYTGFGGAGDAIPSPSGETICRAISVAATGLMFKRRPGGCSSLGSRRRGLGGQVRRNRVVIHSTRMPEHSIKGDPIIRSDHLRRVTLGGVALTIANAGLMAARENEIVLRPIGFR